MPSQSASRLWAIEFSNGWQYTPSDQAAIDARASGLTVVEYALAGPVGAGKEEAVISKCSACGGEMKDQGPVPAATADPTPLGQRPRGERCESCGFVLVVNQPLRP